MSGLMPLLLSAGALLGGAGPPALVPPVCEGVTVGQVHIVRNPIFHEDPDTAWLYRTMNRLHVRTRDGVVRREVLLRAGDGLDLEALTQTERNLRAQPFLAEAQVDLLSPEGEMLVSAAELAQAGDCSALRGLNVVDVRVTTRDTWSTTLESTLRRSGSQWIWELGVDESNLLGRGKGLELAHRNDLERNSNRVTYLDPRLAGSRTALKAEFNDGTDGQRVDFQVGRPFFSLDTRWSFQSRVESFDRTKALYDAGDEVARLRWLRQREEFSIARRVHRGRDGAMRLHLAYRKLYEDVGVAQRDFGFVQVGFSVEQHRFLKLAHLTHERPEDVNLGTESALWFGVSTSATGGGRGTAYYLSGSLRRGIRFGPATFALARLRWEGRFQHGQVRNGLGDAKITFVDRSRDRRLLLVSAWYRHGTRLDPEIQLTLGSDNGHRGYPTNQWVGNRSLLLSAERRWFLADDVIHLASLGVAVFVDSGFAWPEQQRVSLGDLKTNVGIGLLIGRKQLSTQRAGMRLDLAYALDRAEGRGRWVLSFGTAPTITS